MDRKRNIIGCAAIAAVPLGIILYLLWSQVFIHDWYLWRFSRSYAGITHPSATRHLRTYKDLGLLIANGNHIDLFAGEMRSYTEPRQRILDYYANKSVPSQLAPGERVPVEVVFVDHGKLSSGTIGFDRPYLLQEIIAEMKKRTPATNLYIVYVLDSTGFDPGFDPRGM